MTKDQCKDGNIKAVYIVKPGDFRISSEGEIIMKRKYGKFTRELIRIK